MQPPLAVAIIAHMAVQLPAVLIVTPVLSHVLTLPAARAAGDLGQAQEVD